VTTAYRRPNSASDSIIITAIALSVAAHALLLAVHFADPSTIRFKPSDDNLEIVLVNSKAKVKPVKPTALAQNDTNGGGEHDHGRVTSNLAASPVASEGDVLQQSQNAVARLEEQQRQFLTQSRLTPIVVDPNSRTSADGQANATDSVEAQNLIAEIRRMEAQIEKENTDYNARPKRGYIGPNTKGVTFATYYKDWQERIERIGTLEYPPDAKGKMYGDLVLDVTLNPDGTIYHDEIKIMRGSGWPILDRAAVSFVRKGAPYHPFPPEMRRDYNVYEIVSKFSFSKGEGFAARGDQH
jgi:protein TonB